MLDRQGAFASQSWLTNVRVSVTLRALPRALAFGRALGTLGYPPIYRCDVLHYAPCNGQRHCFGKCMCLLGALAPVISVVWLRHEAPKRGVLLSKRQEDRSVPLAASALWRRGRG